jgi:hypothetical protein
MPPRRTPATGPVAATRPITVPELITLIEDQRSSDIMTTGMTIRPRELPGAMRGPINTARAAIQFQLPIEYGIDSIPDYVLAERPSADFSRLSRAIHQAHERNRFR